MVLHTLRRSPQVVTSEALKSWWSCKPRERQQLRKRSTSRTAWKPFLSSVRSALEKLAEPLPLALLDGFRMDATRPNTFPFFSMGPNASPRPESF